MTNLREEAKAFEPKKTLNVADLEALSLETKIEDRTGKDKEGKEFKYKVVVILGEDYRIPTSVIEQIQALLDAVPTLKTVKVNKKGEGLATRYLVTQVE